MEIFNERLKCIRKERKITQEKVAQHLSISNRAYQNYEYGNREPNIATLIKLADYFSVTVDYLVGHTDEQEKH